VNRAPTSRECRDALTRSNGVGYFVVQGDELDWEPYDRYPGRHRAALSELAGLRHTRANFIRHEPGEQGTSRRARPSRS
jgi:hypothetical protein